MKYQDLEILKAIHMVLPKDGGVALSEININLGDRTTLYRHVKGLLNLGLIGGEGKGRWTRYFLTSLGHR